MIVSQTGKRRRTVDRMFTYAALAAALTCVLILVILVVKLFLDGIGHLNWHFISSPPTRKASEAGILTPLIGSLVVMVITTLISVPVGVGAAIWLEEFNTKRTRFTEFIQLNIANLAGVPSIVYGILGLAFFVRTMNLGRSVLAGGLTMSILILPMVIIVSQEALRAVPRSYREGSLALGATRWQTISKQVLPSALPGILTGLILSISRAIGETAPLIVVGAAGYINYIPSKLSDSYTVLPLQIFNWARNPNPEVNANAASAILFLMVLLLAMNSFAIYMRARASKRQR